MPPSLDWADRCSGSARRVSKYSLKFVIHEVTSITILILRLYEVLYDFLDFVLSFGGANESIDLSIINSEMYGFMLGLYLYIKMTVNS